MLLSWLRSIFIDFFQRAFNSSSAQKYHVILICQNICDESSQRQREHFQRRWIFVIQKLYWRWRNLLIVYNIVNILCDRSRDHFFCCLYENRLFFRFHKQTRYRWWWVRDRFDVNFLKKIHSRNVIIMNEILRKCFLLSRANSTCKRYWCDIFSWF